VNMSGQDFQRASKYLHVWMACVDVRIGFPEELPRLVVSGRLLMMSGQELKKVPTCVMFGHFGQLES